VLLGTFLKIAGPINQNNKSIIKVNLAGKPSRSIDKKAKNTLYKLYNNNNNNLRKLEELISKWKTFIDKNPDLEVSCYFLSLDKQIYAEIKSDVKLSAASSIKVPILIVLLKMLDEGELLWNENLILTQDVIGSGAGWMGYQKIGTKFPIFELATEMIRVSDNTATNLLIKRLGGIDQLNQKFNNLGLENTKVTNYLPDLKGTNLTSTKDLTIAIALVDNGYLLTNRSRDIFREIMKESKTNTLIPKGILRGLGKETNDIDYQLLLEGYMVYNKTGDIGISYADTSLIQTPYNSRAFATFIVKGPFNDPRSTDLIRNLSAELVPYLQHNRN
tara:strand:+ start:2878 stop:3870 length:993 start_codon:yes stop_codon:yes gene_type:complete